MSSSKDLSSEKKKDLVSCSSITNVKQITKSSKYKRKVLTEEEYISKLGAIIRRDFFPTLAKLEAQYEYLTAMEQEDFISLKNAAEKLTNFESNDFMEMAPNMSLDDFQSRFVTEDTRDFEKTLDQFNRKKLKKFGRLIQGVTSERPLMITTGQEFVKPNKKITRPENTRMSKDHNVVSFVKGNNVDSEYQKILKEYTAQTPRGSSLSDAPIAGGRDYDFRETPARNDGNRKFRIPDTPSRETLGHELARQSKKAKLFKSPAIQRLMKAQTPKIGSVFDNAPPTSKRRR